jgi:hypothetical protein
MMQIFNFLNCRRLYDEFNIFKGLCKARLFIIVWVLIIILQVLIVTFGGRPFNVVQWVGGNDVGSQSERLGNLHTDRLYLFAVFHAHKSVQRGSPVLLLHEKSTETSVYRADRAKRG